MGRLGRRRRGCESQISVLAVLNRVLLKVFMLQKPTKFVFMCF